MRCEICGRWAINSLGHDCPKAVLNRIDKRDRDADLEAEIQEEGLEDYRDRLAEAAMGDESTWA